MCGGSCGGSSSPQFFQTKMGRKFYEYEIPKLVEQLEVQNLLKLAELCEIKGEKIELIEKAREKMGLGNKA